MEWGRESWAQKTSHLTQRLSPTLPENRHCQVASWIVRHVFSPARAYWPHRTPQLFMTNWEKMLEIGVNETPCSDCLIVLVPMVVHFCVDFHRWLQLQNLMSIQCLFFVPSLSLHSILLLFFSTLNLTKGYLQISILTKSKEKKCFLQLILFFYSNL